MSASRAKSHLDPRGPLVLDTRELGRRPGSMRRVGRELAAPPGWGLELVRVPEGSPVTLDLRLEAVMDGVLVSGTVTARIAAECGRCLEPVTDTVESQLQELFAYDATDDADAPVLDGDLIDLEPLVRDSIVLGLPMNPVCADDCAGLCTGCGGRLDELGDDHTHESADPRWASLSAWTSDGHPADPPAPPMIGS
jgi:uncharacterized protein